MDQQALKHCAKSVAVETERWMASMIHEVSGSLEQHRDALEGKLKRTLEEAAEAAGQRDARLMKEIGSKIDALREDVKRIGIERDEAFNHKLEAVKVEAAAELQQAVSDIRAAVTEEIAVAARSTHETFSAELRALKGRG